MGNLILPKQAKSEIYANNRAYNKGAYCKVLILLYNSTDD